MGELGAQPADQSDGALPPGREEEVVAIVKTAERLPNARVRAVGSSWSFSDIAVTPGFLVETSALNGVNRATSSTRSVLTENVPTRNT